MATGRRCSEQDDGAAALNRSLFSKVLLPLLTSVPFKPGPLSPTQLGEFSRSFQKGDACVAGAWAGQATLIKGGDKGILFNYNSAGSRSASSQPRESLSAMTPSPTSDDSIPVMSIQGSSDAADKGSRHHPDQRWEEMGRQLDREHDLSQSPFYGRPLSSAFSGSGTRTLLLPTMAKATRSDPDTDSESSGDELALTHYGRGRLGRSGAAASPFVPGGDAGGGPGAGPASEDLQAAAGKAGNSGEGEGGQSRLLLVSLLENFCELYDRDPEKNRRLFLALCRRLSSIGVLRSSDFVDEMRGVRGQYRAAFKDLVMEALEVTDDIGVRLLAISDRSASSEDRSKLDSGALTDIFPQRPAIASRYFEDFQEKRTVGKGGYGRVVVAENNLDGREYAVKMINFASMNDRRFTRIMREVKSLAALEHTNIVRYHSAWIEQYRQRSRTEPEVGVGDCTTTNETITMTMTESVVSITGDGLEDRSIIRDGWMTMLIQMELCHFTLGDWIEHRNRLINSQAIADTPVAKELRRVPSSKFCLLGKDGKQQELNMYEIKRIFKHIVRGLVHIHANGLIHRDLKPQNIFFKGLTSQQPQQPQQLEELLPKIGDFGLVTDPNSTFLEATGDATSGHEPDRDDMTIGVGTTTYAAPEQLSRREYDEKADIFSLGIVFFELLNPFTTAMERALALRDLKEKQTFPPLFLRRHPKEAALIWSCLARDPSMRPSAWELAESELLEHDINDLLGKLALENDTLRQMLILQESEADNLQQLYEIQVADIEDLQAKIRDLELCLRSRPQCP